MPSLAVLSCGYLKLEGYLEHLVRIGRTHGTFKCVRGARRSRLKEWIEERVSSLVEMKYQLNDADI
jgi:hypothetical protein